MDGRPLIPEDSGLVRAALHGESVVDDRWRIRRPDGTELVAQGSATPVVAEDGTRLGAVLAFRDITAQYDLERQKDDFLSAVAHDLRTPLTSIKGRIQLLRRRAERGALETPKLLDELGRIETSASRMVTLISELLDVANIEIGRPLTLSRRPVDLVGLVRSVLAEHQQAAEEHHIAVEARAPELIGNWDATRLERVLANLLSNAIKYSPGQGDITVVVAREGPWAVLEVSDRGVGIPAADLPHIFERFHRAENVAGKIPGTGIGLAAVREIVEQHGGSIAVRSTEGVGSTFTVRLPL
jgi:signal transduction histidine kinase